MSCPHDDTNHGSDSVGNEYARADELKLLYETSRVMNSSENLEEFVRFILEAVNRVSGGDCSMMLVASGEKPILFFSLSRSIGEADLERLRHTAVSSFNGLSSTKVHDAQLIIYKSHDYLNDVRLGATPADSHWIPLFRKGHPAGILGICPSVTGSLSESMMRLLYTISNQASATLDRFLSSREAEQSRFSSIVNSMTEGIVVTDLNGHIRLTNPAADKIIANLELDQSKRFYELLGSRELAKGISRMKKGNAPSISQEIAFNAYRTVIHVTASPVLDSKENRTGLVFVLSDITKQKQIQEQMIQTEKLTALGELISGVAHELNNPLASVIGYAQLLQNSAAPADLKKKLDVIHSESRRCQRIVQDLLTFARKHPCEKKRMDVNSAIDSVLQLLAYQFKVNSIELKRESSADVPVIIADFHHIQQVLLNILNNALQALLEVKRKRTIIVTTSVDDRNVIVEVKDNGPGIKDEVLDKVFDPFFTTKEPGRGTGLGLSIARGTIRDLGGDIQVSSAGGEGATFLVIIPRAQQAETQKRRSEKRERSQDIPKGMRVLVVDDEEKIFHIIQEALQEDGHVIGYASDGDAALKEMKQSDFDLIISDIKMPSMDGKRLYATVNKKFPHLKNRFIFITGDTASSSTHDFLKKKKARYLSKPFDIDDIKRIVRETFLKF